VTGKATVRPDPWRWAAVALSALCGVAACASAGAQAPLALDRTIPLAGVKGRIDHLAVDVAGQRLFVAELGNGSVEAIDLRSGKSLGRITGLAEPQGLAYLADRDELAVANGGDGTVRFYKAADLAPAGMVRVGDDADNLRIDTRSGRLVVGYGDGALATIDPASRKVVSELKLPGHPEGFRLDGPKAFVNVPDAGAIVAGDIDQGRVTATWKADHRWNFPMALDGNGALVTVYRLPARLAVMADGAVRGDVSTCGDADDVFVDGRRQRFYVVCGSGDVEVRSSTPPYASLGRAKTRSGARTGLFVPEQDRLFVAARAAGSAEAAILVFKPID
jgi:hypothetical protein